MACRERMDQRETGGREGPPDLQGREGSMDQRAPWDQEAVKELRECRVLMVALGPRETRDNLGHLVFLDHLVLLDPQVIWTKRKWKECMGFLRNSSLETDGNVGPLKKCRKMGLNLQLSEARQWRKIPS